jgi:hypothetical protein
MLDVTFREDERQIYAEDGAKNMAHSDVRYLI